MLQGAGVGHAFHLLVRAGLHVGGGVNMGLNAAGGDDPAGGVDDLNRFISERARRADGHDATILHTHISGGCLGGHYNGSTGDQQVKHGQPPGWRISVGVGSGPGFRLAQLGPQLADDFLGIGQFVLSRG